MASNAAAPDGLRVALRAREPWDWASIAAFLAHRRIAGVETVDASGWRRAIALPRGGRPCEGWVDVRPAHEGVGLLVTLAPGLESVADEVLARVARLFDLDFDPSPALAVLGELARDAPGARLPGAFEGFEIGARAILGQQVSVRAAHTLAARIAERHGHRLSAAPSGFPMRVFPSAATVAALAPADLAACGIVRVRAEAIVALARALDAGALSLEPGAPLQPTLTALRALRGIGDWTAQYLAMRALRARDAFPAGDLVLRRALGVATPAAAVAAAEGWRPWRAMAVLHLWRRAQPQGV